MRATAFIGRVTGVTPHPDNAELRSKLDVVTIVVPHGNDRAETSPSQYINCANREDDDQPRYKVGDYAVVLTENTILPDWLIKRLDMWNYEKNKGGLGGSKGNRLKTRTMGVSTKIVSEVALLPCRLAREDGQDIVCFGDPDDEPADENDRLNSIQLAIEGGESPDGQNVAPLLNITDVYVP